MGRQFLFRIKPGNLEVLSPTTNKRTIIQLSTNFPASLPPAPHIPKMLRMEVQAAWQLKRPLEAMAAISEKSMMVVSPDWFLLTAMNEDDRLPAVLRLPPDWFLRYELTGIDLPYEHYYAVNIDLSTFRANLLAAYDLDLVRLHASTLSWDVLFLTFESQGSIFFSLSWDS